MSVASLRCSWFASKYINALPVQADEIQSEESEIGMGRGKLAAGIQFVAFIRGLREGCSVTSGDWKNNLKMDKGSGKVPTADNDLSSFEQSAVAEE